MSNSTRVDTVSLIPGACVVSLYPGLGITGAALRAATATGDHGPGILFNDWDSGDDTKEFRAFVATPPAQGALTIFEDGSLIWSGLPDGAHSFGYELFVDGVSQGSATATATIGSVTQAESGGASAVIRVAASGAGATQEDGAASGGSSAAVRVSASGGGQANEDQGGTGATAAQVATAVRAELALELSLLMDLARIHGLVYSDPLTVTPTSRNAGPVSQTVSTNGDQVTVQRA